MLAMGRPGGTPMVATERLVTNLQPAAAAIARLACQAARHVGSAVHDLRSGASVVEPLRDTSISASIAPIRQVGLLFRQAGDVVGGVSRGDQLLAVGRRCPVLELALPALLVRRHHLPSAFSSAAAPTVFAISRSAIANENASSE
jgi:hypothetical protein